MLSCQVLKYMHALLKSTYSCKYPYRSSYDAQVLVYSNAFIIATLARPRSIVMASVVVLLMVLQRSGGQVAHTQYRVRSESNSPVDRWGTIQQALQHTDVWEQVQCNNAYKALFPGANARDAGPCQAVMASSYRDGTCSNDVCRPAVEHMLSACVHWKIPDVPAGNPLAGKTFRVDRAESIRSAMIRAGCQIDFVQLLVSFEIAVGKKYVGILNYYFHIYF